MGFAGSYLWSLRQQVGHDLVLMPGAQVVLVDGSGRVLFQQRVDNGEWDLPSGGAEKGGSFVATAVAEVAEEVGVTVNPDDLTAFGCLSEPKAHTVHYPNGDVTHYFSICFEARTWSGQLAAEAGEIMELAWPGMTWPRRRPRWSPAPSPRSTCIDGFGRVGSSRSGYGRGVQPFAAHPCVPAFECSSSGHGGDLMGRDVRQRGQLPVS